MTEASTSGIADTGLGVSSDGQTWINENQNIPMVDSSRMAQTYYINHDYNNQPITISTENISYGGPLSQQSLTQNSII